MKRSKRYFYNSDGTGVVLYGHRGPMREEIVYDEVDDLLGTPVTTLCYCVSCSDVVIYPSSVVSTADWRETPIHRSSPVYRHVHDFVREALQRGWDIPAMVQSRAREKGIEFIPSMRMNDMHFAQKVPPQEHPLTSRFWMEHQHLVFNPGAT
ncbi:MAG: hypothetical protein HQ559_15235, partial [Lentisphaerae bacterium]|nr:hypothetical protein [Lentisphaerota bacterium]